MPKDDWLKVAILYDKTARYSPSNDTAIDLFCESAIRHSIYPTIIGKLDNDILANFDGLFIRDTTHPGDYTYEFAIAAEMMGKKVIDNPTAIMQGCNKIWQCEMFERHNVPYPKTWSDTYFLGYQRREIPFPCVLKIPDSCFSQGVYRCANLQEYETTINMLSKRNKNSNSKILCQEFIQTSFDWRITIFQHQFLFAIKYFMVKDDWKIIKYDRKGEYISGNHECIPFDHIPPNVLKVAHQCDQFLTDGLYGIDIKEVDGKAYVIEVNDNPSIDAGVEDEIEGQRIYDTIMRSFRKDA